MKKLVIVGVLFLIVLSTAFAATEEPFWEQVAYQLRQRAWTEEELTQFRNQARLINWENLDRVDPAMVAYALHQGTHNAPEESTEMAEFRVRMAYEAAHQVQNMHQLGFQNQFIAQTIAQGVHEVALKQQLGQTLDIGKQIRENVQQAINSRQQQTGRNNFALQRAFGSLGTPGGRSLSNRPFHAGGQQR
jgi:hypothetical protein